VILLGKIVVPIAIAGQSIAACLNNIKTGKKQANKQTNKQTKQNKTKQKQKTYPVTCSTEKSSSGCKFVRTFPLATF